MVNSLLLPLATEGPGIRPYLIGGTALLILLLLMLGLLAFGKGRDHT
ncbi:MAG: hypothetical protein JWR42_1986 [Marmoricola sp.]|jgi:hypothetical protein|nr:hypothetical protein [Marmoricola sp.]